LCVERWQDDDRRWLFVNFGPDTTEIGLPLADKRLLVASSTNALVGNALSAHAAILVASSQPGCAGRPCDSNQHSVRGATLA
jgi:hypothetical protein